MFYKKLLLLFLPLLVLLLSVNLIIDPAHLFSGGAYEYQIAKILLKKKNAANVANYDERLLQKYFIEGLTVAPDIVILGSSRSMQINQSFFPDDNLINNSVSGGHLKDYLAIYNLYIRKGLKPEHVYICLDPWILNDNNNELRWKSIESNYEEMIKRLGLPNKNDFDILRSKNLLKYKELLSFDYFQHSIKTIYNPSMVYETLNRNNNETTRLSDGSISYDKIKRERSIYQTNLLARDFIKGDKIDYLENFNSISSDNLNILIKFIQYLQSKNIKIDFLLLPYHSIVYNYLQKDKNYHNINLSEIIFNKIGNENGIKTIGSFNPEKIKNITDADFYDGVHLNEKGLEKIILKKKPIIQR